MNEKTKTEQPGASQQTKAGNGAAGQQTGATSSSTPHRSFGTARRSLTLPGKATSLASPLRPRRPVLTEGLSAVQSLSQFGVVLPPQPRWRAGFGWESRRGRLGRRC